MEITFDELLDRLYELRPEYKESGLAPLDVLMKMEEKAYNIEDWWNSDNFKLEGKGKQPSEVKLYDLLPTIQYYLQ